MEVSTDGRMDGWTHGRMAGLPCVRTSIPPHLHTPDSIECSPPPRQVHQNLRGGESRLKTSVQILQLLYDSRRSDAVHIPERAAAEGREADPEDRADVAVPRRPQHALLKTQRGLVDHREDASLDDLIGRNLTPFAADDLIDA